MWYLKVFLLLLCLDCLCLLDALKVGDNGVCNLTKTISKTRRRPHPIKITMKCGNKVCKKNLYTEKYVVKQQSTMCCSGWQYNFEKDHCECLPPTKPHPTMRNVCYAPECVPSCNNATCVDGNLCECHLGFIRFNDTHCGRCDHGYELGENLSCSPKCDPPCINSTCTAPDTCTCYPDFDMVEPHICSPGCKTCVKAKCSHGVCICKTGFKPVNSTHCAPVCHECDGICIAPKLCICHEGFMMTEFGCEPVCSKCGNGYCVAPETCECFQGYLPRNKSLSDCYKPCSNDCRGECVEGECIEECKPIKL